MRWALVLLVGCAKAQAPQPAPLAGACATCHAAESATWQASLHRASFSDPDFQRSFALEPLDFCVSCHAPEASSRHDAAAVARGVGCASCHADVQAPVAGHHPRRSTSVPCAKCHEFEFPDHPLAMQSTQSEHDQLAYAAVPCAECHMGGARSHRFDVTRNASWLQGALLPPEIAWQDQQLAVTLRTGRVGHAFPTGDLFRRLQLTVWVEDAAGAVTFYERRRLGKRYSADRKEVEDTRIFGERAERFAAPPVPGRVHVDVSYQRVAFPTAHDAVLFAEVPLAHVETSLPAPLDRR